MCTEEEVDVMDASTGDMRAVEGSDNEEEETQSDNTLPQNNIW